MKIKKKQENSDTKKNAKGPEARVPKDLVVKKSEKVQGGQRGITYCTDW